MEDFKTYKKKFIMVKKECMCFLPEGTPNTSSPQVAESQPSTADKTEVQCGSPEGDPETSSTGSAVLKSSSPLAQWKDHQKTLTVPEDQPSSSISSLEQEEAKEVLSNFQLRARHVLRVFQLLHTDGMTCKESINKQKSLHNKNLPELSASRRKRSSSARQGPSPAWRKHTIWTACS